MAVSSASLVLFTSGNLNKYQLNVDDEIQEKLLEQDKIEKAKGRIRYYKWGYEHGYKTEEEYRRACEEAKTIGIQEETEA